MAKPIAVVDFETKGIEQGSYPPKPVGLALAIPGRPREYLAFGHPTGNNCDESLAKEKLRDAYREFNVLGHNMGGFDMHVARKWWGLWPQHEYHDTMFLRFLMDPHAKSFGLKESAEELYDIKPDARDSVRQWLIDHGFRKKVKKITDLGKFICEAPGDVVAPYAIEDTRLPEIMFRDLYPKVVAAGMETAYQREINLIPTLMDMFDRGVQIDCASLERDFVVWERQFAEVTDKIMRSLHLPSDSEFPKPAKLAEALERAGKVDKWVLTETGKKSISADSLELCLNDPELKGWLEFRGILSTCIETFARNWLKYADASGRFHVQWNSTRRPKGSKGIGGARTGRLSSFPNFQNLIKARPGLPHLRRYIVPGPGLALLDRDYSQQEFRILAHFEDGPLMRAYLNDPRLDIHKWAQKMILERSGLAVERTPVKVIGFGLIYGMGIGLLAQNMGKPKDVATAIKKAYLANVPGVKFLQNDLKDRAKSGRPLRTLGGRLYYCEPPRIGEDGRPYSLDYKLLNYLVQGSAADMTKMAMVAADRAGLKLVLTVHDEIIIESEIGARASDAKRNMNTLRECMESIALDVPLRSDGKWSTRSWGQFKKYVFDVRESEQREAA